MGKDHLHRQMVKDSTDGKGYNGWLRIQLTGIQNMFFIIQMFKAFCYGCSNLWMTPKSKKYPENGPHIFGVFGEPWLSTGGYVCGLVR